MRYIILSCSFLVLTLFSCIKDKNPPIPAYIYVPSFEYGNLDPVVQGSSNHNFVDVWISVDGQVIGANNLPTILPTIISDTSGIQNIRVFPGIEKNGIASSRALYPFMNPYEVSLNLEQGRVDTLFPIFSYNPLAQFILIDDFEGPGVAFGEDLDLYPGSYMANQSVEVFEGQSSGQLIFDSLSPICYVASSADFSNLQTSTVASHVYLELHYNTNIPVIVGLVAKTPGSANEYFDKGGVNSSDGTWKKIYFVLTEDIFSLNAQDYQVYFRTGLSPTDSISPKVYIDNIKFVHF